MRSPSYPKIQIFDLEGLRGNESIYIYIYKLMLRKQLKSETF